MRGETLSSPPGWYSPDLVTSRAPEATIGAAPFCSLYCFVAKIVPGPTPPQLYVPLKVVPFVVTVASKVRDVQFGSEVKVRCPVLQLRVPCGATDLEHVPVADTFPPVWTMEKELHVPLPNALLVQFTPQLPVRSTQGRVVVVVVLVGNGDVVGVGVEVVEDSGVVVVVLDSKQAPLVLGFCCLQSFGRPRQVFRCVA